MSLTSFAAGCLNAAKPDTLASDRQAPPSSAPPVVPRTSLAATPSFPSETLSSDSLSPVGGTAADAEPPPVADSLQVAALPPSRLETQSASELQSVAEERTPWTPLFRAKNLSPSVVSQSAS